MISIGKKLATAVEFHKAGNLDRAESLYREVVRVDPSHADALHLLGVTAHQKQQHQTAVDYIRRAIAVNRSAHSYHCNLGAACRALGRLDEAVESFREALRLNPNFAGAHYNLAMALDARGDREQAFHHYREAIRLNPRFADAYNNLGNVLSARKEYDEAIDCFQRAIEIHPGFANAHYNLANALQSCDRLDEAVESFRQAIRLNPQSAQVHNNLGLVLKTQEKYDEAALCFERAIQLNLEYAEAYSNLGSVRQLQKQWEAAIRSFQQATKLAPQNADLHYNLATAYQHQKRIGEAIACFQQVLEINPNLAEAHFNLAIIYEASGNLDLAERHFEKSLEIQPADHRRLQRMTMLPPVYQSQEELFQYRRRLNDNIRQLLVENFSLDAAEKAASTCFYVAYQGCADRPLLEKFNRLFCSSHVPVCGNVERNKDDGRIRIGFASRYFRNHTIGRLMQGLIARLSRKEFHVTVFSNEKHDDQISRFIREQADDYIELTTAVPVGRQRIVDQDLDVLFYPDLGMDPVTYALAHNRLAPVQCVTWGHPVTTGMNSIDYFVSSDLAETEDAEEHYTERLVLLNTLPTYYYRPELNEPLKSRRDFGLPEEGSIYLCPQSLFKIHPEFDRMLAEILRRDPNGRIVLINGLYGNWTDLLKRRFAKTIPGHSERILFLPRQTYADYHNLMRLSDVMLDPIHFGGGNTNYEAMAFGVPVVTLPSQYLRGRVAYALYRKMNVLDCVAGNFAEYVDLAVQIATDAAVRQRIQQRILDSCDSLFEENEAVREVERFLKQAVAESKQSRSQISAG